MLIIRTAGIRSRTQHLIHPGLHFPGKGLLASRLGLLHVRPEDNQDEQEKEKGTHQSRAHAAALTAVPPNPVPAHAFEGL